MRGDDKPQNSQHHIACLDGLRGVAAIAVLAHHSAFSALPFESGYLGVDFFFCLSGYVIGLAYERRLRDSLTLNAYMAIRLVRLWPMLILGAILGLCTIGLGRPDGYFTPYQHFSLFIALVCQIFFIPFVIAKGAFVLNGPQWSILFELIANFFHGIFIRQLTNRILLIIITISAACLVVIAKHFKYINFGWGVDNFFLGFPRVGFSFFAGLLLYRTKHIWHKYLPDLKFWWISLILLLAIGLPNLNQVGFFGAKRDIGVTLVLIPLVVALGARSSSNGRGLRWLGVTSYPLYALHAPLLVLALWIHRHIFHGQKFLLAADALIILLAFMVGLLIDEPLNRWRKGVSSRRGLGMAAKSLSPGD